MILAYKIVSLYNAKLLFILGYKIMETLFGIVLKLLMTDLFLMSHSVNL